MDMYFKTMMSEYVRVELFESCNIIPKLTRKALRCDTVVFCFLCLAMRFDCIYKIVFFFCSVYFILFIYILVFYPYSCLILYIQNDTLLILEQGFLQVRVEKKR